MRKIALLLAFCMILTLSGCQGKPAADQTAENGNAAPAADLPETQGQPETAAAADPPQTAEDPPPGDAPAADASDDDGAVVIKEKMFLAQIYDIYLNTEDYLGKTIKYEGVFMVSEVPETGEKYYSVIRYGPGCCGFDAIAGFEVRWDKDYPKQDDWVEAVGVLEEYEKDGSTYRRLNLSSLTVLPTRGAEQVSQ